MGLNCLRRGGPSGTGQSWGGENIWRTFPGTQYGERHMRPSVSCCFPGPQGCQGFWEARWVVSLWASFPSAMLHPGTDSWAQGWHLTSKASNFKITNTPSVTSLEQRARETENSGAFPNVPDYPYLWDSCLSLYRGGGPCKLDCNKTLHYSSWWEFGGEMLFSRCIVTWHVRGNSEPPQGRVHLDCTHGDSQPMQLRTFDGVPQQWLRWSFLPSGDSGSHLSLLKENKETVLFLET